jgi:hypothetical protein
MKKSVFRTKLSMLILLVLACCTAMTSCGTYLPDYVSFWQEISPEDTIEWMDDGRIRYNGTIYESIENSNGMISADYDAEGCVKIATMPYSYLLGAVSVFYGDELDDPDIITCVRGGDVWVREGMDIHEMIMDNTCVVSNTFSFRIRDVITDEVIPYSLELDNLRSLIGYLRCPLEDYPAFRFSVQVVPIDGNLYLQYVWDSDFYRITEEFEAALYENGLVKS